MTGLPSSIFRFSAEEATVDLKEDSIRRYGFRVTLARGLYSLGCVF